MKRIAPHRRNTWRTAILAAMLLALNISTASAHAGHSHADDDVSAVTLMQIGGVVLILAIACLVANRFYQERDAGTSHRINRKDEPKT